MPASVASPRDLPPPRDARTSLTLPAPLTALVGREDEVATIRRLLSSTRLLTLTGAGGSGKTRLAIEVAHQCAADHPDGAAWVELAPLSDPELLASYVGTALHVELGARPAIDSLLDALHGRDLLLVLDNCEHLVDACASLLEQVLALAPGVRVLATSREALGVAGERAWLVPTLATPATDQAATPEAVLASPAGRLFVERAEAAHARFRLTTENAGAVASISRRLDGPPLAIELAAARVRALSPDQIAARLDNAFRVLTSAPRAAISRHRTLGEAIDWSYALLEEGDRIVLQRLSVFVGDFSLEAAEAVCAPTPADAVEILDRLVTLVDKSLVVMVEGDGTARYRLLETIRQYAAERLEAAGGGDEVRERHARFYIGVVREAEPHLITGERAAWMERVLREMDNLRAVLAWTRDHAPLRCLRLAGSLGWVWYSSGLWFEGRRWLEEALALPVAATPTAARGIALLGAGVLSGLQAQVSVARPWLEEAAAILHAEGDHHREAYALAYLGVTVGQTGAAGAEE
ncbi:MAG: ATP-binding protein, partial [Gemmatimonadota bacterium]